eukprot:scaffold143762_cov53-Attheya_sp.AAC.4
MQFNPGCLPQSIQHDSKILFVTHSSPYVRLYVRPPDFASCFVTPSLTDSRNDDGGGAVVNPRSLQMMESHHVFHN